GRALGAILGTAPQRLGPMGSQVRAGTRAAADLPAAIHGFALSAGFRAGRASNAQLPVPAEGPRGAAALPADEDAGRVRASAATGAAIATIATIAAIAAAASARRPRATRAAAGAPAGRAQAPTSSGRPRAAGAE